MIKFLKLQLFLSLLLSDSFTRDVVKELSFSSNSLNLEYLSLYIKHHSSKSLIMLSLILLWHIQTKVQ